MRLHIYFCPVPDVAVKQERFARPEFVRLAFDDQANATLDARADLLVNVFASSSRPARWSASSNPGKLEPMVHLDS